MRLQCSVLQVMYARHASVNSMRSTPDIYHKPISASQVASQQPERERDFCLYCTGRRQFNWLIIARMLLRINRIWAAVAAAAAAGDAEGRVDGVQ